jgi:hypothetical protein
MKQIPTPQATSSKVQSRQRQSASKGNILNCCDINTSSGKNYLIDDLRKEPLLGDKIDGESYYKYPSGDAAFLEYLTAIVGNSPTLSAIIERRVSLVVGTITADTTIGQRWLESEVNSSGETVQDVLTAFQYDKEVYNNAALQGMSVGGSVEMYHIPAPRWRYKITTEDEPTHILVSTQFEDTNWWKRNSGTVEVLTTLNDNSVQRWAATNRRYHAGSRKYGLPVWLSAAVWAELEYQIARYNMSLFENGFMPSGALTIFGANTPDEAREVLDALRKSMTGTGRHGKIFAQVLQPGGDAAKFEPYESARQGEFVELMDMAYKAVCRSMSWPTVLIGEQDKAGLSSQQLRLAYDLVNSQYVKPQQDELLRVLKHLLRGTALESTTFSIAMPTPLSLATEAKLNDVMTINEQRALLGLPEREDGDRFVTNTQNVVI